MILPHDITGIYLGDNQTEPRKGPAFRKGYIIKQEYLEHLRRLGKGHIYALSLNEDEIHENEAARLLANALGGPGVVWSGRPSEGKLNLLAKYDGLLKVNIEALFRFNMFGEVICATPHSNTPVKKGDEVGATRPIPLVSQRHMVEEVCKTSNEVDGILEVKPIPKTRAGLVIAGNEVFYGRIEDKFAPILKKKLADLNSRVVETRFAPDDEELIAGEIRTCIGHEVDIIVTSGGMSVDPETGPGPASAGPERLTWSRGLRYYPVPCFFQPK